MTSETRVSLRRKEEKHGGLLQQGEEDRRGAAELMRPYQIRPTGTKGSAWAGKHFLAPQESPAPIWKDIRKCICVY